MGDIIVQQSDLPHSSVVLLGNQSETGTEGEEGEREIDKEVKLRGGGGGSLTRHLSVHLVLHVWGWRATADHTLRGHVVTVRRLRRRSTLTHPTRAHGHVLSGRLQAHNTGTKTHISWLEKHLSPNHSKAGRKQHLCTKYSNQL